MPKCPKCNKEDNVELSEFDGEYKEYRYSRCAKYFLVKETDED
jgi:hypothetical protein